MVSASNGAFSFYAKDFSDSKVRRQGVATGRAWGFDLFRGGCVSEMIRSLGQQTVRISLPVVYNEAGKI